MLSNRVLRSLLIFVAFGVVVGLFLRMISFTVGLRDMVRVSTDFHRSGLYISDILPLPLVEEAQKIRGEWQTVLLGWPAFLDVKPMVEFDVLDATLRYRAAPSVRGLRWGMLVDQESNAFRTVYAARILSELGWNSVAHGDVSVYSEGGKQNGATRALGVSVPNVLEMPGYVARDAMQSLHVNLRGEHRLLVYANKERIRFSFAMQDMNRTEGADEVMVRVSNALTNESLYSVSHADDGNVTADQKQTGLFSVNVVTDVLPHGIYQIEVLTNDDVFIRDFSTSQQKFVLRERANLGDVVGYSQNNPATTMLVYGSVLEARLEHPRALQTLRVGDGDLSLGVPFVVESMDLNVDAVTSVRSPKNDVALVTDGVIGFSQASMFTPILPLVSFKTTAAELRERGVGTLVVSRYAVPLQDQGEIVLRDVRLDDLNLAEPKAYRFSIEPVVTEDVPIAGTFLVSEVVFSLRRPPTSLLHTLTHLRSLLDRKITQQERSASLYPPRIYGRID